MLGNSPFSCFAELLVAVREGRVVRRAQGGGEARAHPESLVLSPEGGPGLHEHLHSQKLFGAQSISYHQPILQMSKEWAQNGEAIIKGLV